MIAIVLLSDVCADLGDGERAALLYAKLEPYAHVNVVIGLAAVCLGSAASFLGRLAATMGRTDLAAEQFERALAANAALGAPACLARTQVDYARALGPGPRAAGVAGFGGANGVGRSGSARSSARVAELGGLARSVSIAAPAGGTLRVYSPCDRGDRLRLLDPGEQARVVLAPKL